MRNSETITLSPSSQIVLTERGPETQVFQPAGTVEFDVEVRDFRHFMVQTPLLAAVVKGTRFVVTVHGEGAGVRVERGLVEVINDATGEAALVAAGQEAEVDNRGAALEVRAVDILPQQVAEIGAANPPPTGPVGIQIDIVPGNGGPGGVPGAGGGAGGVTGGGNCGGLGLGLLLGIGNGLGLGLGLCDSGSGSGSGS
jgi:hypothetical protein